MSDRSGGEGLAGGLNSENTRRIAPPIALALGADAGCVWGS